MDRNKDNNKANQHLWQFLEDNKKIMIIIKYKKWMIFGLLVEDQLRKFIIILIKIMVK
jgi:hypothetical protein